MASFFIGGATDDAAGNVDDKQFEHQRHRNDEILSHRIGGKPIVTPGGVSSGNKLGAMIDEARQSSEAEGAGNDCLVSSVTPDPNTERLIELLFGDCSNGGESRQLFCELEELNDGIWYESARWVRFEEDVEIGGDRWSKPFVAAISLHSLFELRHHLSTGAILLDVDITSFSQLVTLVADALVENNLLESDLKNNFIETLMLKHVHQHEHTGASLKRGLSEIGKKFSAWRMEENSEGKEHKADSGGESQGDSKTPKEETNGSCHFKPNEAFAKKLAPGSEGSTSLVGGVEFLTSTVSAFVRLSSKVTLHECSEVAIPTRFVFIILGPIARAKDYREVGRAMETVMSDDIFRDVAYRSSTRADLLTGFDEFLDETTALPPSEWDPKIRIEPPKRTPSCEARKMNVLHQMSSEKSLSQNDLIAKFTSIPRAISESSYKTTTPQPLSSENGGSTSAIGVENPVALPSPVKSEMHASVNAFMNDLLKKQTENDAQPSDAGHHGMDPDLMRTGRIFGGLVADIKRKAPWFRSDFTDALNVQCVASVFYLFFACLAPIVTFGGLLGLATDNNMAAFESILTGSVCGTSYHLFAGQPVTIIGSTGPVLLFEKILFNFTKENDLNYLTMRFWIGVWAALYLLIIVMFDLSSLVSLITRFTEECFATLISVIFIFEAFLAIYGIYKANGISTRYTLALNYTCSCDWVQSNFSYAYSLKSVDEITPRYNSSEPFDCRSLDVVTCGKLSPPCQRVGPGCDIRQPVPDVFFFSCLVFLGTCALSFSLKNFRLSPFFPAKVRSIVSDFAVSISIFIMVAVDFFVGLPTPKLRVPQEFAPTRHDRGWLVEPFANPVWTIVAAPLPAILLAVLLFMDQQITAVIVNRKEHKLTKGKGYHLDLFVLTCHVTFCAIFGLPYFVAATVLSITHVNSLRKQSETSAPGEVPRFLGLIEQRVTGFVVFALIGCAIPLRGILKFIPMPVLYGVFLYMGLAALQTSQFYQRVLLFFMPIKYQPDTPYLRHMKTWRVHLFTFIQLTAFIFLWVIKNVKSISILFILMLVVMVILRKLLDFVFTQDELKWVDDPLPANPLAVHKPEKAHQEVEAAKTSEATTAAIVTPTSPEKPYKTAKHRTSGLWRRFVRNPDQGAESQPLRNLAPPPEIVVVSPSRETSMHDFQQRKQSTVDEC